MRILSTLATAIAIATTTVFNSLAFPEATAAFTITSNSNGSDLLNTLLGDTPGLSNFSVNVVGDPSAFGIFRNDPFGLGSGIVLSTGKVEQIPGQNTIDNNGSDLSTDFQGDSEAHDSMSLNISFDADTKADKLLFQYVFGSEEFLEYVGGMFNDSFELLLNGVNLAQLSDGNPVSINNLGINQPDYINNPVGSNTNVKLDGFTKVLTFEGLLNKNAKNTLTINIKDVDDGTYDSAVFLKGQSLRTKAVQDVPEPSVTLGLLAMVSLGIGSQLLRKQNKLV